VDSRAPWVVLDEVLPREPGGGVPFGEREPTG